MEIFSDSSSCISFVSEDGLAMSDGDDLSIASTSPTFLLSPSDKLDHFSSSDSLSSLPSTHDSEDDEDNILRDLKEREYFAKVERKNFIEQQEKRQQAQLNQLVFGKKPPECKKEKDWEPLLNKNIFESLPRDYSPASALEPLFHSTHSLSPQKKDLLVPSYRLLTEEEEEHYNTDITEGFQETFKKRRIVCEYVEREVKLLEKNPKHKKLLSVFKPDPERILKKRGRKPKKKPEEGPSDGTPDLDSSTTLFGISLDDLAEHDDYGIPLPRGSPNPKSFVPDLQDEVDEEYSFDQEPEEVVPPKKKLGRPRKYPAKETPPSSTSSSTVSTPRKSPASKKSHHRTTTTTTTPTLKVEELSPETSVRSSTTTTTTASSSTNNNVHLPQLGIISSMESSNSVSKKERVSCRTHWTPVEKDLFKELFLAFGKDWKTISEILFNTKTPIQVKNYFFNYKHKIFQDEDPSIAKFIDKPNALHSKSEDSLETSSSTSGSLSSKYKVSRIVAPRTTKPSGNILETSKKHKNSRDENEKPVFVFLKDASDPELFAGGWFEAAILDQISEKIRVRFRNLQESYVFPEQLKGKLGVGVKIYDFVDSSKTTSSPLSVPPSSPTEDSLKDLSEEQFKLFRDHFVGRISSEVVSEAVKDFFSWEFSIPSLRALLQQDSSTKSDTSDVENIDIPLRTRDFIRFQKCHSLLSALKPRRAPHAKLDSNDFDKLLHIISLLFHPPTTTPSTPSTTPTSEATLWEGFVAEANAAIPASYASAVKIVGMTRDDKDDKDDTNEEGDDDEGEEGMLEIGIDVVLKVYYGRRELVVECVDVLQQCSWDFWQLQKDSSSSSTSKPSAPSLPTSSSPVEDTPVFEEFSTLLTSQRAALLSHAQSSWASFFSRLFLSPTAPPSPSS